MQGVQDQGLQAKLDGSQHLHLLFCLCRCKSDKCSDCNDCPEKTGAAKEEDEKKRAWWALRPFATWPENNKQQPVGKKIPEDRKEEREERPWWNFWVSKDKKKEEKPFWKFWG